MAGSGQGTIPDIEELLGMATKFANQRNTLLIRLFPERPMAQMKHGIDLLRLRRYSEAVAHLVEHVLSRPVSHDYGHMALCFLARALAGLGRPADAERLLQAARKVRLPQNYAETASLLEEETLAEINRSRVPLSRPPDSSPTH